MSWLYIPVPASEFGERNTYSDGGPCATSRTTPTASESCKPESGTDCSTTPPSGMTSAPSTGDPGLDWWMSSRRDSPANPGARRENVLERWMSAISGLIPFASLEKSGPDTACWRTPQDSFEPGTSRLSARALPRAGMMLAGKLYRRRSWARRINAIACGLWPTPTADNVNERKKKYAQGGTSLNTAVRFPTPVATMWKNRETSPHSRDLQKFIGGTLNPDWVEWLMGCPIGSTALEPLATDKFQSWLRLHGIG